MNRYDVRTDGDAPLITLSQGDWKEIVRLLNRATVLERLDADQTLKSTTDRARHALAERRRRGAIFGAGLFGEPAWDILLVLYTERHAHRHSVGSLAKLAGLSPSTALRWIDALVGYELVRRAVHPTDKRAAFVQLTDKGESALDLYFSETLTPAR